MQTDSSLRAIVKGLIFAVSAPCVCDDNPDLADRLLNDYREYVATCDSGRIQFSSEFRQLDGSQKIDVSGTVEWAEDYNYSVGRSSEIMPRIRPGIKDHKIQIAMTKTHVVARLETVSSGTKTQ